MSLCMCQSVSCKTLLLVIQYLLHSYMLRYYSDLEQNIHKMQTKLQWTNEKSVQLPSNTNLAGGYMLICNVLCMEVQNAGMKTQLSGKFFHLGKLLKGASYSLRLDISLNA